MFKRSDLIEGSRRSNDCTRPCRRRSSRAKLGRRVCILDSDDRTVCPAAQLRESAEDHGNWGVGRLFKCT